jgi:uncharacterized membrane protein
MSAKQLRLTRAIIAGLLGAVSAFSVLTENFIALLIAVIVAVILLYFFSRVTKEITQDERTRMLYTRASRAAVAVTIPLAAIISVVLIALKSHLPHDVEIGAYTLSLFCCVILLAHAAFYSYYNRKS